MAPFGCSGADEWRVHAECALGSSGAVVTCALTLLATSSAVAADRYEVTVTSDGSSFYFEVAHPAFAYTHMMDVEFDPRAATNAGITNDSLALIVDGYGDASLDPGTFTISGDDLRKVVERMADEMDSLFTYTSDYKTTRKSRSTLLTGNTDTATAPNQPAPTPPHKPRKLAGRKRCIFFHKKKVRI